MQTYNCGETHLGGGVLSPFVFPLSIIAWEPDPTVVGSIALRKGPQRFCPHCCNHCCKLDFLCAKIHPL